MGHKSYNGIPVTNRSGEELARYHGFEDLDHLINEIPENAHILDVGAGRARLGHAVTFRREDVTWTNLDPAYSDKDIRWPMEIDAPPNLKFVADSGATLSNRYSADAFDMALSFFALPHLDQEKGEDIVQKMFHVTKPGGLVSVGPDEAKAALSVREALMGRKLLSLHNSTYRAVKGQVDELAFTRESIAKILPPHRREQ
jgi:ubiquinone/menaquinone biosynthesis C-methylase UbiE